MASRRSLKKQIFSIMSELINECMVCHMLIPSFDATKLDSYLGRIVAINNEFIERVNHQEHAEDRKRIRAYYRALIEDFNTRTIELIKDLNAEDAQA